MANYNDYILARNTYYIKYESDAVNYDYITVDLYVWSGTASTPPATPKTLTVYKVQTTDTKVAVDVSDYIKSFLDPVIDDTWLTNDTSNGHYGEIVWVKWTVRAYKLQSNGIIGNLFQTVNQPPKPATLGYGDFIDGANSTAISNTMVIGTDKYSNSTAFNYNCISGTVSTNTDTILTRSNVDYKNSCSHHHTTYSIAYLNKYGIWDDLKFNRLSKRTVEISNDKYDFYTKNPSEYSTNIATTKIYNIKSKEEYLLNTDLLDDVQNSYMEQLFTSDRHYLIDWDDSKIHPVILSDKKFEPKLSKYEKAKIQWTVKFELANNKINDIR